MGTSILLKYGRDAGRTYNWTLPSASVGQGNKHTVFKEKKFRFEQCWCTERLRDSFRLYTQLVTYD